MLEWYPKDFFIKGWQLIHKEDGLMKLRKYVGRDGWELCTIEMIRSVEAFVESKRWWNVSCLKPV